MFFNRKPKICSNCKWCKKQGPSYLFYECKHPKNKMAINIVDGTKVAYKLTYCESQRSECLLLSIIFGECGKSGRWFEEKEKI